jgi:surface polysaccharide O-acyltransferase-like enzyme
MAKERNYGIDALRIVSMVMVVTLHLLAKEIYATKPFSTYYWMIWVLQIIAFCAVNVFAIISGYVMYQVKYKPSRIINLWIEVLFYSFVISAIVLIINPGDFSKEALLNTIFPISRGCYWYISAYIGMYIFIPILNLALEKLDRKTIFGIIISALFIIAFATRFLQKDPYGLKDGYSVLWLSILYLVGGYCSKYDIFKKIGKTKSLLFFLASASFTFLFKFIMENLTFIIFGEAKWGGVLIVYTSPTMFLSGFFLVSLFANIKVKESVTKIVSVITPTVLGVYIIHQHTLLWKYIQGAVITTHHWYLIIFEILGYVLIVYLLATVIDLLRIKLFKIIKIRELSEKAENLLKKITVKLLKG